ncbi:MULTISPECIES: ATP-binding protein [Vibrio]|uniref:ATP-binding protein n=1 Tax=Vibrio TaxID=662 RepID=UPI00296535DD|nr:ATP-binding protein [Vibrio sp. Vb5029]MDW1678065.1 ATP-binding protein [Vibrio sp. Vb5029]
MANDDTELEIELIQKIKSGSRETTKLETDDKVLARVTDGIYRLPGSAIRELISNAYDADAENVYVSTDVPRFNSMTIRDDGNGMSIDTLVNMIRHIGGSAKRTAKGQELKVTDEDDPSLSPIKKRKLIGKIGIGLFSVAQLTRDFEIITKQKGDNFYSRAKVSLFNYSEENIEKQSNDDRGKSFQTGNVDIWKEETDNISAHGTDIILNNIKISAKDQLRSVDIWGQTENETDKDEESDDILNSSKAILPDFHVGYLEKDSEGTDVYQREMAKTPELPWTDDTLPEERFKKLYEGILDKTKNAVSPKLNLILDNYLNMIWTLGLSIPLPYIEKHPFNLTKKDIPDIYVISNKKKGQVSDTTELLSDEDELGQAFGFSSQKIKSEFNVVVDGIKLFRPLKFTNLPESKAMVKKPILFVGKYETNLSSMALEDSAGNLEFEAYVLWTPKVSPRDHNGSLIRINDASGIMFDETFMKHQVAEHTIKSQLTIEIFVNKGLDSALNIDRESFNIAHPHYQIVMRWLHSAIRQVVNKYKQIKKEKKKEIEENFEDGFSKALSEIVSKSYISNLKDPDERANLVVASDNEEDETVDEGIKNIADSFIVSSNRINKVFEPIKRQKNKQKKIIDKSEAILQILDSYGLLESMTVERQEQLVLDLIEVIKLEG